MRAIVISLIFVLVPSALFGGSFAIAADLVLSTDKYMADKPARISEIRKLCQGSLDRVKVDSGKQAMLFVCAFDVSHTTGFNAVTQDAGVLADLHKIQTMDYTFEMLGEVHSTVKGCLKATAVPAGSAWQDNEVAFCVAMRGYDYGKHFGRLYLAGKK